MEIIKIPGGTFCDEPFHEYQTDDGVWVPSITQVFKLQGITDYSGIDPDVLANAARRGSEVHQLAAAYSRDGEVDPSWISEETEPYFNGVVDCFRDTGFVPDPEWTEEQPIIATIHGMKIGVTPDCHGKMGRDKAIIEFKCASVEQPAWSIQTAIQEMAIYKSNHVGRVRRFALQLFKDGKYRLRPHTKHEEDGPAGIAALRCVWWRINAGQDLRRLLA